MQVPIPKLGYSNKSWNKMCSYALYDAYWGYEHIQKIHNSYNIISLAQPAGVRYGPKYIADNHPNKIKHKYIKDKASNTSMAFAAAPSTRVYPAAFDTTSNLLQHNVPSPFQFPFQSSVSE